MPGSPRNASWTAKRMVYWTTDDGVTNAELVIALRKPATFNIVSLREYLPLGQRIGAFAIDQWKEGRWIEFASGTSIGECRLVRGAALTTEKSGCVVAVRRSPAISEVGLYAETVK